MTIWSMKSPVGFSKKIVYSKKFLKQTKDRKEVLAIHEDNTYSYSVISKTSSKPKFSKNKVSGTVAYYLVKDSDGMAGVNFSGKGNRSYKDDIGTNQKWYLSEITTTHLEFVGTKYLDIKFRPAVDEEMNSDEF